MVFFSLAIACKGVSGSWVIPLGSAQWLPDISLVTNEQMSLFGRGKCPVDLCYLATHFSPGLRTLKREYWLTLIMSWCICMHYD